MKSKYEDFANIILLDPIYDQRKLDVLRGNAFVYIHGHSAGGTNPSLVEAMYLGLPIIAYKVSYNRTTTENKALYFTDAESLAQLVADTPLTHFKNIGETMKEIGDRRYTWPFIAEKYHALVEEALVSKYKTSVDADAKKIDVQTLIDMDLGHLKHQQGFFQKR